MTRPFASTVTALKVPAGTPVLASERAIVPPVKPEPVASPEKATEAEGMLPDEASVTRPLASTATVAKE